MLKRSISFIYRSMFLGLRHIYFRSYFWPSSTTRMVLCFGKRFDWDCPESSEVECEKSETKTDATEMTGVK